jgi:hypothetical protein
MAVTPSVAEIVDEFERALRSPDPTRDGHHGVLIPLLALHENNIEQWNREDTVRRDVSDDRAVAAAKRDIDLLNTKRHELVEAIDVAFAACFEQVASAPPTTESPAMVLDRLSVLVIRIASTARVANSEAPDREVYAHRLPRLHEQLARLQEALNAMFDDVRAGRKRFVPYESLKLYRAGSVRPSSHGDGNRRD